MKIKTSELNGATLNWAVAKCEDIKVSPKFISTPEGLRYRLAAQGGWYEPSTNWNQGGLIIDREKVQLSTLNQGKEWCAALIYKADFIQYAETALKAAMRCYVASKLGNEIDIPENFINNY